MISAKKLSGLLASLHSAPLEEANWQVFFDGVCEETLAVHGFFLAAGLKQGTAQILAQGGKQFIPEAQQRYNEYFWRIDPYWESFRRKPRNGPILGEELVPWGEASRTEFYNDLAAPCGLGHSLTLPAVVTPSGVEALSIWRSAQQKPFDRLSTELFELLLPHIQTALKTRRALALANVRSLRAEMALDSAADACFILNGGGKVVHFNRAAEILIQLQDGLSIKKDKLSTADTATQNALQTLIASAASASGALLSQPGGTMALLRPSGKQPFYAAVSPLRLPIMTAPAHVLVVVTDPEVSASFPDVILKTLFGLTSAETQIANALLTGLSVEEIAELRSVTPGTLRVQLKAIFQKTNTRRQSELVRLLRSLPRIAGTS